MNKLVPGFLKRIDHHLLTNHPLVWRTRVHYFLFYGLLVGNLLAYLLPLSGIGVLGIIPTENEIFGGLIAGLVFCGFLALFWGFDQQRFPIQPQTLKGYLKTMVLYTLCVFAVGSVFFTGTYTSIAQLAKKGKKGTAIEYGNHLSIQGLLNKYPTKSHGGMRKDDFKKSKEILSFFNSSYTIKINQFVINDPSLLEKKVNCFKEAQKFYYKKGKKKISIYDDFHMLFIVLLVCALVALFFIPVLLTIWSNLGFLSTLLIAGLQFMFALVVFSFCKSFDSNPDNVSIVYLSAIFISFVCISMISKPNKISRFFAWSTIPFSAIFLIFLVAIIVIESDLKSFFGMLSIGLLLAIASILMTSILSFQIKHKTVLPKLN